MRFRKLDLNLLVALDSLLTLSSVSQAAESMNLSQPAMSAALGRLRDYFGDDLLVPHRRRMIPTAFAQSLAPQVRALLENVDSVINTSAAFDPSTSQRSFRIGASDYVSMVVIAPLLERLTSTAPQIRLEIIAPSDEIVPRLRHGEIDLLVTPEEFLSDEHPSQLLFEEEHVIIGGTDHPIFDSQVTVEAFRAYGHVGVEIGSQRTLSFGERHLGKLGIGRRIEIVASSFAVVPWMVLGTRRLAVIHSRLAEAVLPVLPLRSAPLPFAFPVMREMIQYHRSRNGDAGLRWLIGQLREASTVHR